MKFGHRTRVVVATLVFLLILAKATHSFGQSLISGFNPATLVHDKKGIFLDAKSLWADNAVSLGALFLDKGWEGKFSPDHTNNLDVFWKFDIGAMYRSWRIATFYRGELFIETNKDSIEFLRTLNLKEKLSVGRIYDIDMQSEGFTATGIELSKGFAIKNIGSGNILSVGFTARYMKGERIQHGTIKGKGLPITTKSYDFNLKLDYVYDHNFIYERRDTNPGTGDGFSFDFGVKYNFNDNLNAELLFRDILGRIYWKDMPYTDAIANSSTKYFDKDGYMSFRPVIRGYEANKDFTQKIPLKTDVSMSYSWDKFTLKPTVNFIKLRPLYWLEFSYQATKNFIVDIGYDVNYGIFSFGTLYKQAILKIYGDNIDPNKAFALGIYIGLIYEW